MILTLFATRRWVGRKFQYRRPRSYRSAVSAVRKTLRMSPSYCSLSDLAGHERYLKTTLYGLTSGSPSCVILIVGGNAGLIGMSKEHLAIALALSVPVVVCITKVKRRIFRILVEPHKLTRLFQIDMTPPNILAKTVEQVSKILRSPGCRFVLSPLRTSRESDIWIELSAPPRF